MPADSIFKSLYWRLNKGETETDTDTDTETKILGYSNFPNQTLGAYVCARCSSQPTPTVQNVYCAQYCFCFYFFWGHLSFRTFVPATFYLELKVCNHRSIRVFWDKKKVEGRKWQWLLHFGKEYKKSYIFNQIVRFFLFFFRFCFDNINSASSPFSTGGWNTIRCTYTYAKTKLSKHEKHEQRLSRRLYNSHLSYLFSRHMWTWKSTKAITTSTLMW